MTRLCRMATLALSTSLMTGLMGRAELAGQTPAQHLFDWDTPPFPKKEYQDRRAALATEAAARNGVFLVFSAAGLSHGDTFRQLDDFAYLVGLEMPESVLAIDGAQDRSILFVPPGDFRFESPSRPNDFPGRPLSTDPAILGWVADVEVRSNRGLEAYLDSLAGEETMVLLNSGSAELPADVRPLFANEDEVVGTIRGVRARFPDLELSSGFSAMAAIRSVKSPSEIMIMERAARMTARAIVRASRDVSAGTSERTLEGSFLDGCKSDGSQRAAFAPIIKSGPNSLWPWRVLASHYDRRDRQMSDGDLVIFDVGCELDGYVSDVGRTLPVGGTFSARQRGILDMEVDVSDRIIAAVGPGVTLAELQAVADAAIPHDEKPYMQVGLFFGHHLGLSTGDPVMTDEPLRPGMIFTVEPWYYNHDIELSVFTEDQVLVTPSGARNLTAALPRRPDALETLMATGVVPALSVDPDETPAPAELSDAVDTYASAWNETDPEIRMGILRAVWAANGRYRDPSVHVRGRQALSDHIDGYQAGLPKTTIQRSGPVQATGAQFYFPWEIIDGTGTVLAAGRDAGELDADGRILEIRGFFDRP